MTKNVDRVLLKKSKRTTEGLPNLPLPEQLVEGELAMNYAENVETLSLKNESGNVVTFSSDNYYTEKKLGEYFTGEEGSAKTVTDVMIEKERVTAEAILDLQEVKAGIDEVLWERGDDLLSVKIKGKSGKASNNSVSEGYNSKATGNYSHAEGYGTLASEAYSHAEGNSTSATSSSSHAEGNNTVAYGQYSHVEGYNTVTNNQSEHASGQYNVSNRKGYSFDRVNGSGNTLFSVGNGISNDKRSNALEIMQNGDIYVLSGDTLPDGSRTRVLLQDGIGTVPTDQVLDETTAESTNPVSSKAVYDVIVEDEEIVAASLSYLDSSKFGNAEYDSSAKTINFYSSGSSSGDIITTIDVSGFAVDTDQVIDSTTSSSTNPVSTSAVYGFVTSYTPSITVDQVLDNTTSASTNPVSSKAVYDAVTDNELVWTNAYVTLSGAVSSHTVNTDIHVTAADKTAWDAKLDATAYTPSVELWVSGTGANSIAQKNGGNTASGDYSVAEGQSTNAKAIHSHAEGGWTTASGDSAHAEGSKSQALGEVSHAEGYQTSALTAYAHSEGQNTLSNGNNGSHAEGQSTVASGTSAHAEGKQTTAGGGQSHAEGSGTIASGNMSHAEGQNTVASFNYAHAEGNQSSATSSSSHAEGESTLASGVQSHAEGLQTSATSQYSHAEGIGTFTQNAAEHASGKYNVSTIGVGDDKTLFSIGNGTADDARHNAFEIRQNGDIYITSGGTASSGRIKLQDSIGSKADKSDLGGLKLVKVTQVEYDALATKDPNTLYVIVN